MSSLAKFCKPYGTILQRKQERPCQGLKIALYFYFLPPPLRGKETMCRAAGQMRLYSTVHYGDSVNGCLEEKYCCIGNIYSGDQLHLPFYIVSKKIVSKKIITIYILFNLSLLRSHRWLVIRVMEKPNS